VTIESFVDVIETPKHACFPIEARDILTHRGNVRSQFA